MSANKFTTRACDEIKYYVYCLVDPRDGKAFYVGKGKGDRVYTHVHDSEEQPDEGLKNRRIKAIGEEKVKHYIIRHGLTEKEAYELESTLIDFLMDKRVNGGENNLTNLVRGYHHSTKGIKSVDDINAQYPEKEFEPLGDDKIIIVLLNSLVEGDDIYERARGCWAFAENKIKQCTHVLAVYHGIVRAVYLVSPEAWEMTSPKGNHKSARWRFTAEEDKASPYLYSKIYSEVKEEGCPRKKIAPDGKIISPRKGAWCANY